MSKNMKLWARADADIHRAMHHDIPFSIQLVQDLVAEIERLQKENDLWVPRDDAESGAT